MKKAGLALVAVLCALLCAPLGLVVLLGTPAAADSSCGPSGPGVRVDLETLPQGPVAGYSGAQLENAALIVNAGQAVGLDAKAQTIGVMAAMGESALIVRDHGDAAGPDSRGLFQQRANGAWGSHRDRMDPTTSATNFFKALRRVSGWQEMKPTMAAHAVQRNSDPNYYTQFWDPAVQIVQGLGGTKVIGAAQLSCSEPSLSAGSAGGEWVKPAAGPLTSPFGMRKGKMHHGDDLGAPCDAPIKAAAGGEVTAAGRVSGYGNLITIDHGGGVVTAYAHMFDPGVLVSAGKRVAAGEKIGLVGDFGNSFGCHLHFEVRVNGDVTDPVAFMAERGVKL